MIKIDYKKDDIIGLMAGFGEAKPDQKLLCATFEEVLNNCVHLPQDVMKGLLDKSANLAALQVGVEIAYKQRTANDTDTPEAKEKILALIGDSDSLLAKYNAISVLSTNHSTTFAQSYRHSPYQCYMAALMVNGGEKLSILVAEPGQGKTFVMMLVVLYFGSVEADIKVIIFNSNTSVIK